MIVLTLEEITRLIKEFDKMPTLTKNEIEFCNGQILRIMRE